MRRMKIVLSFGLLMCFWVNPVLAKLMVRHVHGTIYNHEGKILQNFQANHPSTWETVKLRKYDRFEASFKLDDPSPSSSTKGSSLKQAMLRLERISNEPSEIYFLATRDHDGSYRFKIDLQLMAEPNFKNVGGIYAAKMILADPNYPQGFTWTLGNLDLNLPSAETTREFQQKTIFHMLPELHHTFASPEKRPSSIISMIFAGLMFVPFLFLITAWINLKANIMNVPWNDLPRLLVALAFQGCIAAVLGLYGIYWYRLNMFQTFKILIPLLLLSIVIGRKALLQVSQTKFASQT